MRRNHFGEAYCSTTDELQTEIESKVTTCSDVYATNLSLPENKMGFTVEIADNVTGDTVCFAESETEAGVREMLTELGIQQP